MQGESSQGLSNVVAMPLDRLEKISAPRQGAPDLTIISSAPSGRGHGFNANQGYRTFGAQPLATFLLLLWSRGDNYSLPASSMLRRVLIILTDLSGYFIGVGKVDCFRPPLPPNRTGGSPASGSPVGSVLMGTYSRRHGLLLRTATHVRQNRR